MNKLNYVLITLNLLILSLIAINYFVFLNENIFKLSDRDMKVIFLIQIIFITTSYIIKNIEKNKNS